MLAPLSGRGHKEDTMTGQRRVQPDWDDVQGHGKEADAEAAEGEAEGLGFKFPADAETAEGDTEGHKIRFGDAEAADGDEDVTGHAWKAVR
jgi:hypothetical protein